MSVTQRRERERLERRSQIVQAAASVFKSKGFSASTMDDIARAAQLSKGTLYLYFKSKDELFLAMSNVKLLEIDARWSEILAGAESGLRKLEALLSAYADTALTDPDLFRVSAVWITSGQRVDTETPAFCSHHDCVRKVMGLMVRAIEEGQADGSVRSEVTPIKVASQLWGGMLGTMLIRINAGELSRRVPEMGEIDQNVSGFIQLVCDGLSTRGQGAP